MPSARPPSPRRPELHYLLPLSGGCGEGTQAPLPSFPSPSSSPSPSHLVTNLPDPSPDLQFSTPMTRKRRKHATA